MKSPGFVRRTSIRRFVQIDGRQVVLLSRGWVPTAYDDECPEPSVDVWGTARADEQDRILERGSLSDALREFEPSAVYGAAVANRALFAEMVRTAHGFGRLLVPGSLAAEVVRRFASPSDFWAVDVDAKHIVFHVAYAAPLHGEPERRPGVHRLRFSFSGYRMLKPRLVVADPGIQGMSGA